MIPRLKDASGDLDLQGPPLAVYLRLIYELDPMEFRPVKQWALARSLQFSERTVRRALKKLVARGYVERGEVRPPDIREYRLVYSKLP